MLKTGKYLLVTLISYVVFAIGVVPIILFTGGVETWLWGVWVGTVLCGFGLNVGSTSTLVALGRLALLRLEKC